MIPPSSLGSYGAVVGPRRERRKGPEYCFVSGKAPRNRGFVVGRRMSHNIYFTTLNEKCRDGITIVRDSGVPLEREYCSQTAVADCCYSVEKPCGKVRKKVRKNY